MADEQVIVVDVQGEPEEPDIYAVVRYYDASKNPGEASYGAPLRDLKAYEWEALPQWIKDSIDDAPEESKMYFTEPVEVPPESPLGQTNANATVVNGEVTAITLTTPYHSSVTMPSQLPPKPQGALLSKAPFTPQPRVDGAVLATEPLEETQPKNGEE